MISILVLLAGLLPLMPVMAFVLRQRGGSRVEATHKLTHSLTTINIVLAVMLLGAGLVWFLAPDIVAASGLAQAAAADPYTPFAAAIAVSVGSIGAGYAVSTTGTAAIGAIAEKPDVFGRALIFVGLAEGVAIYGLIIAFIILNR